MSNKDTTEDSINKGWDSRLFLALFVLGFSIIGVTVICGIILWRNKDPNTAQYILGAILPLLGTWVGTILAFYFTRENFESASKSVQDMARQLTAEEKLESIPVRQKMIPKDKLVLLKITASKPIDKITIVGDILELMKQNKRNRLPVLDENDYPKYMIHRSMIDQYLTRKNIEDKLPVNQIEKITLKDLLDEDPELKRIFESTFAAVKEAANLAEAKSEMDKIEGCLDVFITKNGTKNEPIVGWLTNLIITESAKV